VNLTLITACAGAALSVAAYFYGRADGKDLAEGSAALAERVALIAAAESREAAASAIAKISVRHTTIQNQLEREVRNVPVYTSADCRVTPDGVRYINAALAGEGQEPRAPELPASSASR